MAALNRLPIKSQISIIVITCVMVSLLVSGTAIVLQERYIERQLMLDNLLASAEVTANRSAAPLIFSDTDEGLALLQSLIDITSTRQACLYTQEGTEFVKYPPSQDTICQTITSNDSWEFSNEYLQITTPSIRNGETVGTLVLLAPLNTLNENSIWLIVRVSLIMLVTGFIALFIARYQQKFVSVPIMQLTQVARNIAKNPNYNVPETPSGAKEIETLWQTFSQLIGNIKDNEALIIEREKNLELTLESIGDAVIATDINGKVTRMNPIAEHLTGWTLDEIKGQPLKKIFKIIDAATRLAVEDPVDKVLQSKKIVSLSNNTTLIARYGKEHQIADSAAPIVDVKNNVLGVILVFHDVSEQYRLRVAADTSRAALEKSEAQVRLLLNSTVESIFGIDIDGICIFANSSCANMLGYSDSRELLGKSITHILAGEDDVVISHQSDAAHLKNFKNAVFLDKEVLHRKDGTQFTAEYRSHPIFEKNTVIGAVITILDVTEKVSQMEQLQRAQKMDALGKLTGGIAHDYNNILGIILGYAQLLKPDVENQPKVLKFVSEIERAGMRGAELTRKLLTFSRHQPSEEKLTDINSVIYELKELLEKTITVRFDIQFNLAPDLEVVMLNKGDLEDALVNLCINASHAAPQGGTIAISTRNYETTINQAKALNINCGKYVTLTVTDSGIGMDEHVVSKIFDPFFTTKGEAGTGLGLTQLYGFMQHVGGTVTVESSPGKGSSFTLLFPSKGSKANLDVAINNTESVLDTHGNETILVVDDEEALGKITQEILKQKGYQVYRANSTEEALDILATNSIRLVLSDIIMPGSDGFVLAREVKQRYPQIIVQLISGFSDDIPEDMNWLPEILQKPVSAQHLLHRIKLLLSNLNVTKR